MKNRVLKILASKRKQIENKENQIMNFENNPLMLFDELQQEGSMIPDMLKDIDENLLIEYQNWQYPYVINALQEEISLSPFTLNWDSETFPSPIYITREGYYVAQVSPYKKSFEVLPEDEMIELLEDYMMLSKRRIQQWEELESLIIKGMNPFIEADDSLAKNIKIAFTRSKIEKDLHNEQQLLLQDINQLDDEIKRLLLQINNLSTQQLTNQHEIDKVYNQFRVKFSLKLVDLMEEKILKADEEILKLQIEAEKRVQELENLAASTEQF